MKLIRQKEGQFLSQADPFILCGQDNCFYLYVTGADGVHAFCAETLTSEYRDIGIVFSVPGKKEYWAPSVLFSKGKYYLYVSFIDKDEQDVHMQTMHVACADTPRGPFGNATKLIEPFSIDAHAVENENGLFLFYSTNDFSYERAGTYIVADRLKDPYTACKKPVSVLRPTLDEEISSRDRFRKGQHWHTLEGAFYFREGDWHYLIYSGNCYQNEFYYLGYASAKSSESDLTKIRFRKQPDENTYAPLISKNEYEEGTGHNSAIKYRGEWFLVYHARDLDDKRPGDRRTARICRLTVNEGKLTAVRYSDKL